MGVFDSIFKKNGYIERKETDIDLGQLHNELKKHHERLEKLHDYSQNLHRYAYYIENSNTKHKKEIIEQINNIGKWLEYLSQNHINLKKEVNELKNSLKKRLKEDFESYHEIIEEYLVLKMAMFENKIEIYKKADKEKEKIDIDILKEKIKEEILKELPKKNEKIVEIKETDLNRSEKDILRLLFNEGKPLTYEQIAEKLNKPVNSVRVYMNNLKIKKPIVEEFLTPSGIKVFSIKNSEMVKTLFNTH